jgi:hypothetical protein
MGPTTSTFSGRASGIPGKTRASRGAASAMLFLLLGAALAQATELKPATLQVWDAYVQTVNSTTDDRAAGRSQFLIADETPDMVQRVRGGELVVTNHDPRKVPNGLIHHWIGSMFIPNATLDQVMSVIDDYDHYSDYYKPFVAKAAVIERNGNDEKVNMIMVQKAFGVTAAVGADYHVQISRPDPNRICIVSNADRVQEIADYGRPSEHLYPEDKRPGYVWRTVAETRLEQRDGGVYVEMETIALSRGIPFEFRWLIKPVTDSLPRKIMLGTLQNTRDAVNAKARQSPSTDQNVARSGPRP